MPLVGGLDAGRAGDIDQLSDGEGDALLSVLRCRTVELGSVLQEYREVYRLRAGNVSVGSMRAIRSRDRRSPASAWLRVSQLIAGHDNIVYFGEYRSPDGLQRICDRANFAWAFNYSIRAATRTGCSPTPHEAAISAPRHWPPRVPRPATGLRG